MKLPEPVALAHDRFIENDDGMRIGTDEPELQWGKYVPDDDGGWFPLYTSPPPPAEVPLLTDDEIRRIYYSSPEMVEVYPFARAIEALVLQKAGLK